jgi:hypothetical protein
MQKNIEELKDKIFELYKLCREETSPARRQTLFGRLWELSLRWCKDYLFKYDESFKVDELFKVEELGEGIFKVIKKLVKMEGELDNFFNFFNKCLREVRNDIIKKEICEKGIKTPKDKTIKVYKIDKYIEDEEGKKGRELFEDEIACICIQHRMDIHEYEMIKNMNSVKSIIYQQKSTGDDIDVLDIYNSERTENPYNPEEKEDPYNHEHNFINGLDMKFVCENIKAIFDKKKTKKRECCRSLLTLYCIENDWLCQELLPLLDSHILDSSILDKSERPTQKEIYMGYYPDVKEDSASVSATRMIKEFLADLRNIAKKI